MPRTIMPSGLALTLFLLATTSAAAADFPAVPVEVSVIQQDDGSFIFQNDFGKPFYTYDRDSKGKSACDGACLETWSPVRAHEGAKAMGDWTLVDRGKGYMQWAYKGAPIYNNIPDVTGIGPDGKDRHWQVLKP